MMREQVCRLQVCRYAIRPSQFAIWNLQLAWYNSSPPPAFYPGCQSGSNEVIDHDLEDSFFSTLVQGREGVVQGGMSVDQWFDGDGVCR
jgi:hypothetical protein